MKMLAGVGLALGIVGGGVVLGWVVIAGLAWVMARWTGRQGRTREGTPLEKGTKS